MKFSLSFWFCIFLAGSLYADGIPSWNAFRESKYKFEIRYPKDWRVLSDDAKTPESSSSTPRFTVSATGAATDCYLSILFETKEKPAKLTYNLTTDAEKKRQCQQLLNNILSTFKSI